MSGEIDADIFLKRITHRGFYLTRDYIDGEVADDAIQADDVHNLVSLEFEIPASQPDRRGICVVCIEKQIELALCPCGHCCCDSCWSTLIAQHNEKTKKDVYESTEADDDDDDDYFPTSRIDNASPVFNRVLRTNRSHIVQNLQQTENLNAAVLQYPPCPKCRAVPLTVQKLFLSL